VPEESRFQNNFGTSSLAFAKWHWAKAARLMGSSVRIKTRQGFGMAEHRMGYQVTGIR
jgi:hypothetical protein